MRKPCIYRRASKEKMRKTECMLCDFCEVVVNVDQNDFSLNVLGSCGKHPELGSFKILDGVTCPEQVQR